MLISHRLCFCRVVAAAILIVPLAAGCAGTVDGLASSAGTAAGRAAAPALADQLNQPGTQHQISAVAGSSAVKAVAHSVGNGVGEGITDEFVTLAMSGASTRPASAEQIRTFVQQNLEPVLDDTIHSAVQEAMRDATEQEAEIRINGITESIADAVVRGATRGFREDSTAAMCQMIRQQIAPAIGDAIREQLAQTFNEDSQSRLMLAFHRLLNKEIVPAVRQMWDQGAADTLMLPTRPDLVPAVRESAQNLAIGTTTGTHAGLIQLGVLSPTGDLTGAAKAFAWGAGIVVALVGLAAAALLVVLAMIAIALWRRPMAIK